MVPGSKSLAIHSHLQSKTMTELTIVAWMYGSPFVVNPYGYGGACY